MGTGGNNVPIVIETHAQDCRWNVSEGNIVQTLAGNMGTGGQRTNDN
jgi:DNA (cytosine-5)-methyltransferase 1